MRGNMKPPALADLRKYNVNRPDAVEAIFQPQYDYQTYAAAGQAQLSFFQVPIGQNSKTKADTNMESAGQMPNPKSFLIESISVVFFPGGTVGSFGAGAASVNINDVQAVMESGYLELFIGSKTYLTDAPIGKFPQGFRMGIGAAASDASTLAGNQQTLVDYGVMAGPEYKITPVLLESNQNFNVSLNWPTAVATPSTVAGRIGVVLNGYLYRLSQ